jgi:hypothetical protein
MALPNSMDDARVYTGAMTAKLPVQNAGWVQQASLSSSSHHADKGRDFVVMAKQGNWRGRSLLPDVRRLVHGVTS